jgi:hypothetical protein
LRSQASLLKAHGYASNTELRSPGYQQEAEYYRAAVRGALQIKHTLVTEAQGSNPPKIGREENRHRYKQHRSSKKQYIGDTSKTPWQLHRNQTGELAAA